MLHMVVLGKLVLRGAMTREQDDGYSKCGSILVSQKTLA